MTGKLTNVPGIGAKNSQLLMQAVDGGPNVQTSFQLFGIFMGFRGKDIDSAQHCQLFFNWLRLHHIHHCTHAIVSAMAEKANIMFPGIYDNEAYSTTVGKVTMEATENSATKIA